MKKTLLIGGAGFIGSNLIRELLQRKEFDIFVLEPEFANVSRIEGFPVKILQSYQVATMMTMNENLQMSYSRQYGLWKSAVS